MRYGNGESGHSMGSIRSFFLMLCGSKSATRDWSRTRPSTWRWRSIQTARRSVLGLRIEQAKGARFWLKVVNELTARGVNDILIAVVDGLKGFPEAITSVLPQTVVQTCIVHLIRNSLAFVSWKDRKAILPSIKAIYRAENADMALVRLEELEAECGKRYPAIGQIWRRAWEHVVPFFAFAPGIRKMIYTTNAVEALHRSLRKIIKTRGSFPNDEAALKLLYWPSRTPVCVGGEPSNGQLLWASSPSSLVSVFQEKRDHHEDEHHGKADHHVVAASPSSPRLRHATTRPWGLTAGCNRANWVTMPRTPRCRWTQRTLIDLTEIYDTII